MQINFTKKQSHIQSDTFFDESFNLTNFFFVLVKYQKRFESVDCENRVSLLGWASLDED